MRSPLLSICRTSVPKYLRSATLSQRTLTIACISKGAYFLSSNRPARSMVFLVYLNWQVHGIDVASIRAEAQRLRQPLSWFGQAK